MLSHPIKGFCISKPRNYSIIFTWRTEFLTNVHTPSGAEKFLILPLEDLGKHKILYQLLTYYYPLLKPVLKVQSYKLYNNQYMVASTQITNTEIFAIIAVLFFKLLGRKVLLINRKDNRNC